MKPYAQAAIITVGAGLLLLLVAVLLGDSFWDTLPQATCLTHGPGCFCEAVHSGIIKQPVNTLSSLAFVYVGSLALLRRPAPWLSLLAWSLIVTGLGSAFYHMGLSFIGQTADVLGMYMLGVFMVVYAWRRSERWRSAAPWWYGGLLSVLLALLVALPETRRWVFAIVLIVGIGLEVTCNWRAIKNSHHLLLGAIVVMMAAYVIWLLDANHTLCDPTSWLQGHALWHVLCAVSGWMLYRYYTRPTRGLA